MATFDKVDLFMPTYNRLEYVKVALESLFETTDPELVNQLIVVDAQSEDGTHQYLVETLKKTLPFRASLLTTSERHVVRSMLVARDAAQSDVIAKVDSDSVPCPGWLPIALDVMNRHSELWVLGIIPRSDDVIPPAENVKRSYTPASFVGGVGLFRRDALNGLRAAKAPYWGWTSHQRVSPWLKGWLTPNLPVFLLDPLPFEPFLGLRKQYFDLGWHRTQCVYTEVQEKYWNWKFPNWRQHV